MKKVIILLSVMLAVFTQSSFAQASGKQYIEIKTSAQCGTCKAAIEKAVNDLDGVKSAELDLDTKIVAIKYDADKTTPEAIKNAITGVGYDADEVPANKVAYDNLHGCCKKPE